MAGIRWIARLRARWTGRVPATTVEAYLRAGDAVYEDFSRAEALRKELAANGTGLWSLPAGQSSQLLATWCAFALHTVGERLVASEYAARPRLAGYLPVMTAGQASAFLAAAAAWSPRARRAAVDPGYDVAEDADLPVPLPRWPQTEWCPATHVEAMLEASRALRDRAQAAFADLCATPAPDQPRGALQHAQGLLAEADAAIGQAEQMWAPSGYQPLHKAVMATLRGALDLLFRVGQELARPSLLEVAPPGRRAGIRQAGDPAGADRWAFQP